MAAYGKQPDKTLAGKKIKLIKLKGSTSPTPDTTGVIESVDSITGKIHVKWDTELESSLTPGVDEYEIQFSDEDFSKYMGTKGESYIIDRSGQGERELFYLIRAKSPHHMVDMFFSSMPEAKKFADKKGLIIKDKIEEKYVDGGVIGESEVLTYLKTKYGVDENQITIGKDNKGKWNILIIDSELDPKTISKWEKEINKTFTKGKIVHKTISFDANNHITYYNGDLTFQNIKDLTGITPVKIQNIEYVEIEDVDPFIKWSATELKNMFGYDIQNIIFSKKVLSDNEIEILDAYAITDDELHSFKYSPMIHTWYSIEEDENRDKYGSDEEFGNGGSISNELENFDLNELDPFETMQYNQFSKSLTKSESLQVLINNVEGDYSQLSPKLAGLAEIQNDIDAKSEFEPYVEKKAKHGALLHHTFTYQNTPDEKWEVEYEMDRDFPIISTITINGQQTDIDSYDEDIIMKVSMEAYQDYIDNLMTSGEYSREDFAADGKKVSSNIRIIVFKHKNNPSLNVTVKTYPNMQITEIENPRNVRFPFVVGQVLNMGHQTWACNNNYLVNDKDVCPEKKVMGIKVSDIPHGHPLRHLYPGKFH